MQTHLTGSHFFFPFPNPAPSSYIPENGESLIVGIIDLSFLLLLLPMCLYATGTFQLHRGFSDCFFTQAPIRTGYLRWINNVQPPICPICNIIAQKNGLCKLYGAETRNQHSKV